MAGMQNSSGTASAGNTNSGDAAGFMQQMKNFFTGGGNQPEVNSDPFAEPAPAPEAPKPNLDSFTQLFEPKKPADDGKQDNNADPFAALTKENLAAAAGNLDFSSAIPDELMQQALSGDAAAMRKAINGAVQTSFVEAMAASNNLMQKRMQHAIDTKVQELVAAKLQDFDINNTVSSNPLLTNPATKPMRDMLTQQIRAANPGISAKELNTQLTGYLTAFADHVTQLNSPQATSIPGKAKRVNPEADAYNW